MFSLTASFNMLFLIGLFSTRTLMSIKAFFVCKFCFHGRSGEEAILELSTSASIVYYYSSSSQK
jgi:hypothetical protein